jgi:hypothetical protein
VALLAARERTYLLLVVVVTDTLRSQTVLKAMLAFGALAAVSVGLMLPAPMSHGRSHFLQPGVYSR